MIGGNIFAWQPATGWRPPRRRIGWTVILRQRFPIGCIEMNKDMVRREKGL